MSFLLATDGADDSALCELLDIVDTWAPGTSAASPAPASATGCQGPSPSSSPSTSTDASSSSEDGRERQKPRKRTRNPEVDVRRRLKKKKEREALLALVHELQGQRDELRRSGLCRCDSPATVEAGAATFCARCIAVDGDLMAALSDNKQLKMEAATNASVMQCLYDAVSTPRVEMELTPSMITSAVERHRSTLQEMHADLGAVFGAFPPLTPNEPFFFRSDTKFDAAGVPRVELSTALYVPWDFRRASSAFAKGIVRLSPFGNATEAASAEQSYSLDSSAPNTSPGLQSVGLVQKHQVNDSMVLMWSSQIFHPTAGFAFLGRARIRVVGLSSELSRIEAFTDLFAIETPRNSPGTAASVDPEAAKSVRNSLVGAFGTRVAYKHKLFLKLMLSLSGKGNLAAALAV